MSTALIIAGCVLGYGAVGFGAAVVEYRNTHDRLPWLSWLVFWPLWGLIYAAANVPKLPDPVRAACRMLDARAERKRLPAARVLR